MIFSAFSGAQFLASAPLSSSAGWTGQCCEFQPLPHPIYPRRCTVPGNGWQLLVDGQLVEWDLTSKSLGYRYQKIGISM